VAGRLVIAHLGSSSSLTAVRNGRSVDTTMGISPAGGIMMGTRSGDLDPGVYQYLARQRHLSPDGIDELVNRRSGLAGMSGLGADMRDLLAAERASPRAADAVGLFCYQCRKAVGGLAAALGGLDELVFTGGIGENCPAVRARICEGLLHLGVALDAVLNAEPSGVVSGAGSLVRVRVIKTREERQIAEHGAALIRQREGVPA
jgi:acetate kinase